MKKNLNLRSKFGKPEINSSNSEGLNILTRFLGISSWNPYKNELIYLLTDS